MAKPDLKVVNPLPTDIDETTDNLISTVKIESAWLLSRAKANNKLDENQIKKLKSITEIVSMLLRLQIEERKLKDLKNMSDNELKELLK